MVAPHTTFDTFVSYHRQLWSLAGNPPDMLIAFGVIGILYAAMRITGKARAESWVCVLVAAALALFVISTAVFHDPLTGSDRVMSTFQPFLSIFLLVGAVALAAVDTRRKMAKAAPPYNAWSAYLGRAILREQRARRARWRFARRLCSSLRRRLF